MDGPFIYDKYVTGKNFIGRKDNCSKIEKMLQAGTHIAIFEPSKAGKSSIIHQSLFNLRIRGEQFVVGEVSLLNVRHTDSFLIKLGNAAIRAFASTPAEFSSIVNTYLEGTNCIFDAKEFAERDNIISIIAPIEHSDIEAILQLPHRLAKDKGKHLILLIEEFQNIDFTEDAFHILKIMDKVLTDMMKEPLPGCTYIFTGSMLNAMKDIFEHRRVFFRQVVQLHLDQIDEKEIIEYIVKGFLLSGKVIDRELLTNFCKLFKNNLFYINHFAAICDSMSKGYIYEPILLDALGHIIAINEPRFKEYINGLTTHQLNLLKAILDGEVKFSAAPVIKQYSLNSSANVKRIKDALMKKEIITFDEKDEPHFLDPLFEYWVRKYYFEMD